MRLPLPLAAAVIVWTFAAPAAVAATPPRVMYERALEREQAVRPGLDAPKVTTATLTEARQVVKAYERLVARHPGSGYTDNALYQAARLSADLWAQTGDDADRSASISLYKRLVQGYPSSSLVTRARPELVRLQRPKAAPAPQSVQHEDRVIPVPPPAPVHVRDVPPLPSLPVNDARPAGERAVIRGITRVPVQGAVRVTIELDREVPYHDERIPNPDRVFIDLAGAQPRQGLKLKQSFGSGAVRQIRVGARSDGTRVVLEVDGAARHSVFALYNPYRLVIDCELPGTGVPPARAAAESAGPEPLPAVAASTPVITPAPSTDSRPTATMGALASNAAPPASSPAPSRARTSKNNPAPAGKKPLPTRPTEEITETVTAAPSLSGTPSVNLQGRFSLSRQLGLGIARVVIDPGHGGHDPGAQVKDLNESDLVLDVALRLEQLLLRQPGVEVILTRRTDVFIPLEERTEIANREEADLFLSIHANASRSAKARGVETYFLNFASNPEAQAVAARENSASGRTMHSLPDIVKAITLNNKLDESRDFATLVQRSMMERLRGGRDLGVKQAPFVVLIGAAMPSILAEISFVTNPQEARQLKSNAYRQRIAEALFDGIAQYQRAVKNIKTVANQD